MPKCVIISLCFVLSSLASCATAQPISGDHAWQMAATTWQTGQHTVWELDWPAAPVGGPVTVETWRVGDQYRYEILEAIAPALIGESLVFNGYTAWQYNRFDSMPPVALDAPQLSPVSDAFVTVDRLIATPPQTATQEPVQTVHGPAQKISLRYNNGDQLILWRDDETQLPVRVVFSMVENEAKLDARDFEPLVKPPERLFTMP
jgi:hypothetical protein